MWKVLLLLSTLKLIIGVFYYVLTLISEERRNQKRNSFYLPKSEKLSEEEKVKLWYSIRIKEIEVQVEGVKEFVMYLRNVSLITTSATIGIIFKHGLKVPLENMGSPLKDWIVLGAIVSAVSTVMYFLSFYAYDLLKKKLKQTMEE